MRVTVDIETALYNLLAAEGYSASAHALPASLGTYLPHIHVERTGGSVNDLVIETNQVDFDVYAADTADAMTAATNLCAWARKLTQIDTPCYSAEVSTLPYNNPDPRHPTLGRVTFKCQFLTRTKGALNA